MQDNISDLKAQVAANHKVSVVRGIKRGTCKKQINVILNFILLETCCFLIGFTVINIVCK